MIECTGLAVRDPEVGWLALCPEYDIAAGGETAAVALMRLAAKIELTVETAQERRLAIGRAVPEEKVAEFLATHQSEQPRWRWRYQIDTDGPRVRSVGAEPL